MNESQEEHYIRYWARGPIDKSDARFFIETSFGGEGNKISPEEAGTRFRSYYLSIGGISLINGPTDDDHLNRPLSKLENERFLKALGI